MPGKINATVFAGGDENIMSLVQFLLVNNANTQRPSSHTTIGFGGVARPTRNHSREIFSYARLEIGILKIFYLATSLLV